MASAGAMLGDADMVPDPALGPMTIDQALRLHRSRVDGVGRAPGRRAAPRTLEEMRPSILAKLELFERARQATITPERRAARERELAAMVRSGERRG